MKPFAKILEDIKNIDAEIEKVETEEMRLYGELNLIDALGERHAARLSTMDRISEAAARATDLKIARELMKNNACIALYHDVVPVIVEVLQKYNGKPYGEKTSFKVAQEVQDRTGYRAFIHSRYDNDEIDIFHAAFGHTYDINCGPRLNENGKKKERLLIGNKINALPFASLALLHTHNDYIEDIFAAVEELKRLRALAVEKQNELGKICGAYNAIARAGLTPIYKDKAISERFAL